MDEEENIQLDEQAQAESMRDAIHERIASLDAPVRNLLLSDDYVLKLRDMVTKYSLDATNTQNLEEITTNYLLGVIRPEELEQTYKEGLSSLTKDNINSIYTEIKNNILNSVWQTIIDAWAEDDENEQIYNELLEMDEIPLPPNQQKDGSKTLGDKVNKEIIRNTELELQKKQEQVEITPEIKPSGIITNEELVKKISEEKSVEKSAWDKKADDVDANNNTTVTSRNNVDTSLPKISLKSSDPYKETIE